MIRETIANSLIAAGRTLGKMSGLELKVELNDHSINVDMVQPDQDRWAWDPDLYKSGNVYVSGYANPIKPRVEQNQNLDTPNVVTRANPDEQPEHDDDDDVISGDGDSTAEDSTHVQLISSGRYREFMRQDLISQLLTPESRWNLLVWAVVALGVLQFIAIISTFWATGSF